MGIGVNNIIGMLKPCISGNCVVRIPNILRRCPGQSRRPYQTGSRWIAHLQFIYYRVSTGMRSLCGNIPRLNHLMTPPIRLNLPPNCSPLVHSPLRNYRSYSSTTASFGIGSSIHLSGSSVLWSSYGAYPSSSRRCSNAIRSLKLGRRFMASLDNATSTFRCSLRLSSPT